MMDSEFAYHYLLPVAVPTILLYALAAVGLAAWAGVHALKPPAGRRLRGALFVVRCGVGLAALAALAQAVQRNVVLATSWPLWAVLAGGAVAVETAVSLYALERSVVPRWAGIAIMALRTLLILLLTAMLCQPLRSFTWERKIERRVAVLADESGSMQIPDTGMAGAEKVRIAEALSVRGVKRPYRLDDVSRTLRALQEKLAGERDWLTSLAGTDAVVREKQIKRRVRTVERTLAEGQKTIQACTNDVAAPLRDSSVRLDGTNETALRGLAMLLSTNVHASLSAAEREASRVREEGIAASRAEWEAMGEHLRSASAALAELAPRVAAAGQALDALYYASLSGKTRQDVDTMGRTTRSALCRAILLKRPVTDTPGNTSGASLLERIRAKYGTAVYTFADRVSEADVETLAVSRESSPTNEAAGPPPIRTDLASAFEKVMADIPAEQLAGVIVLSDGRHNGAKPVEDVARRLGLQQTPVSAIVLGDAKTPPTDAGIASLEAPDTVYAKDKMVVTVDLKMDNLAGTNVTVVLSDGDAIVDSRTIPVPAESYRTRIQLSDEPKTNGLHLYRVSVAPCAGEVVSTNNDCAVPVRVTEEKIKLLLVDGQARWEFRYLKNLFANRDRSVKLQYVLWHPDQIAQMPERPAVAASAARPDDDSEATALPESETEWLKFDVIILGDADPSWLDGPAIRALRKFVAQKGGALVVISGPLHMPHAFGDTELADLLPVTFTSLKKPLTAGPEAAFRIERTREGRESPILRLAPDPGKDATVWSALPDIHWRHAIREAKPAASVLAYAMPLPPPEFMQTRTEHEVPDAQAMEKRQLFERQNALIVAQHYGLGRVLFLAFDHTWRLRYRTGDTYHHRFWGQVLRWATADKILYGTTPVKLGTDQSRYPPDSRIRIRAKIVRPDYTPVVDARPTVEVFEADRKVLQKRLQYVTDSAGVYAGDLGQLPEGRYRAVLDLGGLSETLGTDGGSAEAEFAVTPVLPVELVELAADRGLLGRLATLTGGRVIAPERAADVLQILGPSSITKAERQQYELWDSWPWLGMLILVAGLEWGLRKKARLP